MPERKNKIDTGTLGSAPCQIALNELLIKLGNPHITHRITSRYHYLRIGLTKLEHIKPTGFCITIMQMYYKKHLDIFKKHIETIPTEVYTHSLCCYKMLLKQAIRRLKNDAGT